jgi:hypothetical protein
MAVSKYPAPRVTALSSATCKFMILSVARNFQPCVDELMPFLSNIFSSQFSVILVLLSLFFELSYNRSELVP